MGSTPTVKAIADEFDMKGATWDQKTNKISTTDGGVVCDVITTASTLNVSCDGFDDMESQTMSIVATQG